MDFPIEDKGILAVLNVDGVRFHAITRLINDNEYGLCLPDGDHYWDISTLESWQYLPELSQQF